MLRLGVNIDHIATVRQARRGFFPDPIHAALTAEKSGAWGITAHLREDRRHIQDSDIERLVASVERLNMEMAVTDEMVSIATRHHPHSCCLVPEKREELTTEGGLDIAGNEARVARAVSELRNAGIEVSLFIDPEPHQLETAARISADAVELHTGRYAELTERAPDEPADHPFTLSPDAEAELNRLIAAAALGHKLGLKVNAGHGIDYRNIAGILRIPHLSELNIGYSIVARALEVGLSTAVGEMVDAMKQYTQFNP